MSHYKGDVEPAGLEPWQVEAFMQFIAPMPKGMGNQIAELERRFKRIAELKASQCPR